MAQFVCSFCDGEEDAVLSVLVLTTGDTVNVGPACQQMWGLVLAGVDPEVIDRVLAEQAGDAQSVPGVLEPAPVGDDTGPVADGPEDAAQVQQERVAAELAARPDGATTSETVVPWPESEPAVEPSTE